LLSEQPNVLALVLTFLVLLIGIARLLFFVFHELADALQNFDVFDVVDAKCAHGEDGKGHRIMLLEHPIQPIHRHAYYIAISVHQIPEVHSVGQYAVLHVKVQLLLGPVRHQNRCECLHFALV